MGVQVLDRPTSTHKVYQELPLIFHAAADFKKAKGEMFIKELGKIFGKHKMNEKFGLIMLHRHFDMEENELLVETLSTDQVQSVAMPWVVSNWGKGEAEPGDNKLYDTYNLPKDDQNDNVIIPQTWKVDKDGKLLPYEFMIVRKLEVEIPTQEFCKELYGQLKSLGLQDMFGLRLRENMTGGSSWETTPEGVRANVTTFERSDDMKKENFIPVVWYFGPDGDPIMTDFCFGRCCNHCDHCNHCNHK